MLYLRTGANGSCKTLFTLRDVRDLQLKENRPVAWNGRFKLKPQIEAEFGWRRIDFKDWQAEPDGTIFLIDECHNDMPVRPNGSTVPDPIRMLAEHRARGFDFFLLTQHPQNIDAFVRKLIGAPGWHQHLKRVFGGGNMTRVLQWDAVKMNCEQDGSGKSAQITTRAQPKEVYGWYDSATLHTGKRRIPRQVFMLFGFLLVAVLLGLWAAKSLMSNVTKHAPDATKTATQAGAVSTSSAGSYSGNNSGDSRAKPMTVAEFVDSQQPRIVGLPHTAPYYDKLTEPKRVPLPAACIRSKSKGCRCFTQDATPYATTSEICEQVVAGGMFIPFETAPQSGALQGGGRASSGAILPAPLPVSGAAPSRPVAQASSLEGSRLFAQIEQRPSYDDPPKASSAELELAAFVGRGRLAQ